MGLSVTIGILIPFIGTSLGAAFVFLMKKQLGRSVQRALTGFAAGVMTAASVWSLLIPAIEQSSSMGALSFVPAVPVMPYLLSFAAGAMIYVVVEELIPDMSQGEHSNVGVIMFAVGFTLMMILDVALG